MVADNNQDQPRTGSTRRKILRYTGATAIASAALTTPTTAQQNTNETTTNETETNETETNETETNETKTNETKTNETKTNETKTNEITTNETETNETASDDTQQESEDSVNESTNTSEDTDANEDVQLCSGKPQMSTTGVNTPNSRITTEDPAVVEANFRPEPTIPDNCTIMVDLEFSFADAGFQWSGGTNWQQSASDLLVGTFEVQPGEVRSIRGQLHTQGAEPGDTVTVIADYELWFKGNPEDSIQQTGIRRTIEVESPNPANGESEDESSVSVETPGFGVTAAAASLISAGALAKSRLTNND